MDAYTSMECIVFCHLIGTLMICVFRSQLHAMDSGWLHQAKKQAGQCPGALKWCYSDLQSAGNLLLSCLLGLGVPVIVAFVVIARMHDGLPPSLTYLLTLTLINHIHSFTSAHSSWTG
jgi:hypothetical protein